MNKIVRNVIFVGMFFSLALKADIFRPTGFTEQSLNNDVQVAFDIDGVLVQRPFIPTFKAAMPIVRQAPNKVALIKTAVWVLYNMRYVYALGKEKNASIASIINGIADSNPGMNQQLPSGELVKDKIIEVVSAGVPMKDTIVVLQQLKKKNYPVALASNTDTMTLNYLFKHNTIPSKSMYDAIVTSETVKKSDGQFHKKPDTEYYDYLKSSLKHTGKTQTIFVDDSIKNVRAAAKAGLIAIHFKSADQLRNDLEALGIVLN
jgi:FMN phosphatase YigB (HAD superfamily)